MYSQATAAEAKKSIKVRTFGWCLLLAYVVPRADVKLYVASRRASRNRVVKTPSQVVFPSVSACVLRYFNCDFFEAIDSDGSSRTIQVLLADYSISCDSAKYNGFYMAYASLMVLIYPVGIPCICFVLLYRHRHQINPELERLEDETHEELQARVLEVRDADEDIHHIAFLFDERVAPLLLEL